MDTKKPAARLAGSGKTSTKNLVIRLIVCVVLFAAAVIIPVKAIKIILAVIGILACEYDAVLEGLGRIGSRKDLPEHFIVFVAAIVAVCTGHALEGLAFAIIFRAGELAQKLIASGIEKTIADALPATPKTVRVRGGAEDVINIAVDSIRPGHLILVGKNETVPVDSIVTEGSGTMDLSYVGGELEVNVTPGTPVRSGSVNTGNEITVKAAGLYENSAAEYMAKAAQEAKRVKLHPAEVCEKIFKIYKPVICIVAILFAIVFSIAAKQNFGTMLYRAMVVAAISCPCAVIASMGVTFHCASALLADRGVITLDPGAFADMPKVGTVVCGAEKASGKRKIKMKAEPAVEEVSVDTLVGLAAYPCKFYESSYSTFIMARGGAPEEDVIVKHRSVPGMGAAVQIKNGMVIEAGTYEFISTVARNVERSDVGTAQLYVAIGKRYVGRILLDESGAAASALTVDGINDLDGVTPVIMANGWFEVPGVRVISNCAVSERESELKKLLNSASGYVAYAGAVPGEKSAMAAADIGIALGGAGETAEDAEFIFMNRNIGLITEISNVSKAASALVKEQLIFALAIKVIFTILAITGILPLWVAGFGDVATGIIALLNAERVFACNPKEKPSGKIIKK